MDYCQLEALEIGSQLRHRRECEREQKWVGKLFKLSLKVWSKRREDNGKVRQEGIIITLPYLVIHSRRGGQQNAFFYLALKWKG